VLVLSRKKGEGIRIADMVEITVLAISNSRVKLGFSAPPEVWLRRNELDERSAPSANGVAQQDGDRPASSAPSR
jgi:carbon storage regulator